MSPIDLILLLSLVGFVLLATEMFMPGMVMGAVGALCLLGAVTVAYLKFGTEAGTVVLGVVGIFTVGGFMLWMAVFPRTRIGKKVILQETPASKHSSSVYFAGLEGIAWTPLRPAGTALLDGRRVDVVAESEFIEKGDPIVVLRDEGIRVVVRKSARPSAAAA